MTFTWHLAYQVIFDITWLKAKAMSYLNQLWLLAKPCQFDSLGIWLLAYHVNQISHGKPKAMSYLIHLAFGFWLTMSYQFESNLAFGLAMSYLIQL